MTGKSLVIDKHHGTLNRSEFHLNEVIYVAEYTMNCNRLLQQL